MPESSLNNMEKPELFDRRWVKWTLFGMIPAALFILLAAGIHVSRFSIDHTIIITGNRQLSPGRPCAMRITLIDDTSGFFIPDSVQGTLVRGNTRYPLFDAPSSGAGYATGFHFTVPRIPPGPAELQFSVRFDGGRRIARAPVTIGEAVLPETLTTPSDVNPVRSASEVRVGNSRVNLFNEDRAAFSGLASVVFLRVVDEKGAPAKVTLRLVLPTSQKDTPTEVIDARTDGAGLFAMALRPFDNVYNIRVEGSTPETAALKVDVVFGGISVAMDDPVIRQGEPLSFRTTRISTSGAVYADLYHDGQWVMATSAWTDDRGLASFRITPPLEPGLYRLQITDSPLGAGRTVAVRHFFVTGNTDAALAWTDPVLDSLGAADAVWAGALLQSLRNGEAATDTDSHRLAAFLLSRLYRGHAAPPRLVTSRKQDDAELAVFKSTFQRGVFTIILLLAAAVGIFISLMARGANRRDARIAAMILQDEHDPIPDEPGTGILQRAGQWLPVVLLLLVVMATFASLGLLLQTLSW